MKKLYASLAIAACAALSANAQIYLAGTGSVNGTSLNWLDTAPYEVVAGADGNYEFTLVAPNGGVKMSTVTTTPGDWNTFNDAAIFAAITEDNLGTPIAIEKKGQDTPNVEFPWNGDWKVVINADVTTMTVTALSEKPSGYKALYIRGNMNGWGAPAEWQFSTEDGVVYTFNAKDETMIPAAETFKIADDSWGSFNFGYSGECFPSEDGEVWFKGGTDSTISDDFEGTVKVTIQNDGNAFVQWFEGQFSGVESIIIDENAPKTYYNLQGVEVENPSNGLFIVKQGNKVAKQVIR